MGKIIQTLNKKGVTPRNWIIMGILVSMIFVVAGTWISTWQPIYYANDTSKNLSSYNYITDLSVKTSSLQDSLSADSNAVTIGYLDFVIKGAYNVLNAVTAIPKMFVAGIRDVGSMYGVPDILIDGFITLMAVGLIFGIIGVIFRRKA